MDNEQREKRIEELDNEIAALERERERLVFEAHKTAVDSLFGVSDE